MLGIILLVLCLVMQLSRMLFNGAAAKSPNTCIVRINSVLTDLLWPAPRTLIVFSP